MSDEAETPIERASTGRADPDVDRLWTREAAECMAAYGRGELAAKDLSEVVAKYLK